VPAHQLDIVTRMGIEVSAEPRPAVLVVDALIGYGLRGDPGGRTAELIDWANPRCAPRPCQAAALSPAQVRPADEHRCQRSPSAIELSVRAG
jgi:hypothetical protein